jgi:hypothetical protein
MAFSISSTPLRLRLLRIDRPEAAGGRSHFDELKRLNIHRRGAEKER